MFRHGVYFRELATALQPMLSATMACVAVGTAPLFNATNPAKPNEPVLCQNMSDFVERFGFSDDFNKFTLCEVAYSFFTLFNIAPVVFINVVDPATHKKAGNKTVSLTRNRATFSAQALLDTLVVKSGDKTLTKDTDYTAQYSNDKLTIAVKTASKVTGNSLQLTYDEINAAAVTKAEIIGGVDSAGNETGIELISAIYPKFAMVPGILIAPKFSTDSEVAAVMAAKCLDINGVFKCVCYCDIDTATVTNYADCNEYKNANNLVDENCYLCWPQVKLGERQFHLSTQAASLTMRLDVENGDVPYESPSNKNLQCDAAVLADGTEVLLGIDKANYLNSIGVATALNFSGGWKLWGNRTACYPSNVDVKDNFLPLRRMMCWVGNTLITTFLFKVDKPINKRLVQSIVNSVNIWLNGLTARECILGGRIEFLDAENPTTNLMDGHITFHCFIGFCVPAEHVEFLLEYDTSYFSTLFS